MVVHLTIVILSPYQRTLKQSPLSEKMVECRKGMKFAFSGRCNNQGKPEIEWHLTVVCFAAK